VFTIRTRIPPDGPAPSGTARIWSVQGAEVLVDNYGRPLRVSAMEAASVLRAYCAVDAKHRYESVELVPADDRAGGDMLGLLRRTGRKDALLSILVRDEQASHRWVAGDGITPLEPQPAPPSVAARIQSR